MSLYHENEHWCKQLTGLPATFFFNYFSLILLQIPHMQTRFHLMIVAYTKKIKTHFEMMYSDTELWWETELNIKWIQMCTFRCVDILIVADIDLAAATTIISPAMVSTNHLNGFMYHGFCHVGTGATGTFMLVDP